MALKAWYTFNNNIDNQGCGDARLTQTTAPTFVDGKLGKALNQGGFKWTAAQTANILNNKTVSICFWVYIDLDEGSTSNRAMFFGNDTMNTLGGRQFSLFNYPTSNDLHYSWQNCINGTYTSICGGIYSGCIPARTWTHVAVTYNNPTGTIYINGEQKTTFTCNFNTDSFAFDTQVIHNSNYHRFNDYRVYDECLSAKQVKEISKGLVCHYKLEGHNGNPNLAKNTNTANLNTNVCYQHFQTGGSTRELEYDEYGIPCVKIIRNDVEQSGWQYLSYDNFDRAAIKTSTTYTVSMDVKASVSGTISLSGLLNGNATNYMTNSSTTINGTVTANQWNHLVFTCTTIADFSSITTTGQVIYWSTSDALRGTGVILWIKNIKLEEGNVATMWVPNINDIAYTALGYNNIFIRDVSGYNYNGIINGTLNYNADSPHYSSSAALTNSYISSPAGAVLANSKDFTINGWFYHTSGTNYYASAESYNTSICLENGRFFIYPANGSAYVGTWSATNNVWQMLTLVHNSIVKTLTLYVNGVQTSQITTDGTVYPNGTLNIGGRQNTAGYAGSMSDFRIYATALSADDILTMYKNSAIIDNKNNVYAYEFKEE